MALDYCLPLADLKADLQVSGDATRAACLDDPVGVPDDDATYVHAAQGTNNYCIVSRQAHSVPAGSTINSVSVAVRTYVDAVNGAVADQSAYIRISGNDYSQPSCGALGSYATTTKTWNTNPDTLAGWVFADLVNIDGFGPKLTTDALAAVRSKCTQSYLIIDYTAPSGMRARSMVF